MLVAQSCPILCEPVDCSLPGSSVHGISQTGILEWVATFFSRGSSRPKRLGLNTVGAHVAEGCVQCSDSGGQRLTLEGGH